MSVCMFWQMYDFVIPLILINKFGLRVDIANAIMAADNVLGLFMLPLFGTISDKVKTKIGRRMPFILAGTALAAIFTVVLPIAANSDNLVLFMVSLGLVLIAMATYRSPAVALMPDVTAKQVRSQGNAVINLMGTLGGTIILALKIFIKSDNNDYTSFLVTVAALMVICVLVMFVTVRENKYRKEMEDINYGDTLIEEKVVEAVESKPEKTPKDVIKSMTMLLASIFLWVFGYNAVTTAFSQYVVNYFGQTESAAAGYLMIATITSVITYIPIAYVTSKIGRRKTILFSLLLGIALFTVAAFMTEFAFFANLLFAGVGIVAGSITVNTLPMVLETSKGSTIGQYTGVYYTCTMSSQILTPVLIGQLFLYIGYQILFPYAILCLVLSFVCMLFVKYGDSKPQVKKKKIETFDTGD
jgi:MFS family permease